MNEHIQRKRFPVGPYLVAAALMALMISLGNWQLDRAGEKRELQASFAEAMHKTPQRIDADAHAHLVDLPRYTPVALAGEYVNDRQALLEAQTHRGVAGYHVWTPLALNGQRWVLINRGWVAEGGDRTVLPEISVDGNRRTVRGLLAPLPQPGMRMGAADAGGDGWPRRLMWPDEEALQRVWDAALPPLLVLLHPDDPDGFVREWKPVTEIPPERHVGYAVQWYGLALALLVITVVLTVRRLRKPLDE